MKAVLVYESYFGNTRKVAEAIATGLRERYKVSLVGVTQASYPVLEGAALLVVGGPTQVWGMSRPLSRKAARESRASAPSCEGREAADAGVREWLQRLPASVGAAGAAFDTRLAKKGIIPTGGAAKGIGAGLTKRGYRLAAEPEGFLVQDTQGPLLEGELERAAEWGRNLAARAAGMGRQ